MFMFHRIRLCLQDVKNNVLATILMKQIHDFYLQTHSNMKQWLTISVHLQRMRWEPVSEIALGFFYTDILYA